MTKKLIIQHYEIFTQTRPHQHYYCQRGHYSNAGAFFELKICSYITQKPPLSKSGGFFMNNN
jgi:hypothetical protein